MENITHEELKALLLKGEVNFTFNKLEGETRQARGTTNLELIPENQHPIGGNGAANCTSFYDLDKKGWRCVSFTSQISI